VNRSKNQFWASGGSLGLNREYSAEYSIGSAAAIERLGFEVGLVARRGLNMARVCLSRRLPLGAWSNSAESSGGACGLPPSPIKMIFAPVSLYG